MTSFGKKGQEPGRFSGAARPLAGSPDRPAARQQPSPHVIYREGETERPSFHGSHIELHWPKYGAAAFTLFAIGYHLWTRAKIDLFGLVFATLVIGAVSYFVLSRIRKSIDDVHTARTELFRSPRFAVGAVLGFGYFLYSTFTGGPDASDSEIARAVSEFNDPLQPFRDGFQQKDLGAVAMLILKAAGLMVLGGMISKAIARRLLGEEQAGSANNAG